MGPRVFTRGNPWSPRDKPPGHAASMGPRVFTRGNNSDAGPRSILVAASMGPRVFTRGNSFGVNHLTNNGGGFNGATRLHAWKLLVLHLQLINDELLQWGHASSRVETARPLTSPIKELKSSNARACQSIASSLLLVSPSFKATPLHSRSERFRAKRASVNRSHANLHNQRPTFEIFRLQPLAYCLDTLFSSSIRRTNVYQHYLILAVVHDRAQV